MTGLLHIYCGDGKGKTTCAMGLAIRAAGAGLPVVVAQFLKSEHTGERASLRAVSDITLLPLPEQVKFTFLMNEEEKRQAALEAEARLEEAFRLAPEEGVLVLDELCAAITSGMLRIEEVTALLDSRPKGLEVVITGRAPDPALLERADYITELRQVRHPYEKGIPARKGIEF